MRNHPPGRLRSFLCCAALLAWAGCDGISPSGGDGGGGGKGGGDMAMSNLPTLNIRWSLEDCSIQGMQCGFSTTCGDAGATKVTITALNPATKKKAETSFTCPNASSNGDTLINLPDDAGPFEISGLLDNIAKSASRHVCSVGPKDIITLTLYYKGCDDPRCTACP